MKKNKVLTIGAVLLGVASVVTGVILSYYLLFKLAGFGFISWVKKQDFSFEAKCKTTEDGFVYYNDKRTGKGLCIISLPELEEVTIPEYIDGKKVMQLGYEDRGITHLDQYCVSSEAIKKLIITHPLIAYDASFNLDTLVFVDYIYISLHSSEKTLTIPKVIGNKFYGQNENVSVELRCSERNYNRDEFVPSTILIPEYVTVIDAGVFDGLQGVTIKTEYESKPEGWEAGWNGACTVEWGVDFNK